MNKNIILIIGLIVCVILSALFSITEISFSSANKLKIKSNYDKDPKKYNLVYQITNDFTGSISTILVGNNLVNIASSSIATLLFINLLGNSKGPTIATVVITIIILIFGEILPKLIGSNNANKLVYVLCYPFKIFDIIFKPITFIVNKLVNKLSRIWIPKEIEPSLTDDELIDIVDDLEEQEEIDEDKSELIRNAIEFSDTTAYDIMIPRLDVMGLDISNIDTELKDFKRNVDKYKSLLIIYKDSLDDILGYIDSRDIIKSMYLKKKINIKDYIKDVYYVNETKKIDDLLIEMKEEKKPMVVVVDEFGGTDGIIKTEDILEELVGDIWDEKDKIELEYKQVSKKEYIVDGDMNLSDMFELLEMDDDIETEYTTIGGYLSEVLDKVPEVNDTYTYKNLKFTVTSSDETSVQKIKIEIQ